jgi:hypothetical protein
MLRTFVLTASAVLSLVACGAASPDDSTGTQTEDPAQDTAVESDAVGSSTQAATIVWQPPPVLIDFDVDPSNAAIANGAIVDGAYSGFGVTFTCVVCSSGHAYARTPGRTNNGVSLFQSPYFPMYDGRYGAVRADFASPRSFVTIDVLGILPPEYLGTPVARPWIEAYDSTNTMVAKTYYPFHGDPAFGTWQTLRVDAPAGKSISYVRFSSQNFSNSPAVYAEFDNLTFNADPVIFEAPVRPILKTIPVLRPFP